MRPALVFALLLLAALPASAHTTDCRYADATFYWSERVSGIDSERDAGADRLWATKYRPQQCLRTPIADIDHPLSRDWGYRIAAENLINALPFPPRPWTSTEAVETRTKLAALLGRDFTSLAELQTWWKANADYLAYSAEADRLDVDEAAKLAGKAVTTRDAEHTITAADYWRYEAKGHLSDVVDDGAVIRGKAWTAAPDEPEIRFRIARSELLDRATKQAAYRRAVAEMVTVLAEPGLGPKSVGALRYALTRITGRTFADSVAWVNWWKANTAKAQLDAQGLRLTTE